MGNSASGPSDFSDWVSRQEHHNDTASHATAVSLQALLNRSEDPTHLFPVGHWLQFTPTARQEELGRDGHPQLGGFLPPLSLPRRMWAGSRIRFHAPIMLGASLQRTTTIESITTKHGSSGELCFIVLRHDVTAEGVSALTEHQTLVYREAAHVDPAAPSGRPPRPNIGAPAGWEWSVCVQPDEIMLFRYSALTFNSHRIHYDHRYATAEEGYPGLVVHGPLSATLLLDAFLKRNPGVQVDAFDFSARSPVFVNEQLHLAGRAIAGSEKSDAKLHELAVVAPDGSNALTAVVTYRH